MEVAAGRVVIASSVNLRALRRMGPTCKRLLFARSETWVDVCFSKAYKASRTYVVLSPWYSVLSAFERCSHFRTSTDRVRLRAASPGTSLRASLRSDPIDRVFVCGYQSMNDGKCAAKPSSRSRGSRQTVALFPMLSTRNIQGGHACARL